jgi:hypothetical protein
MEEDTELTNAAPLVAADIPCTFDFGAILTLSQRRAATTRFEFRRSVEALVVTSQAVDGACIQVIRTGACTSFKRALLPVIIVTRLVRGVRGWGSRGGRGFVALVNCGVPSPALAALRRRRVGGTRVTRDTTSLLVSPVMISRRAVCVLGRGRGVGRSPFRQTAVLGFPTVARSSIKISTIEGHYRTH